jgi:hypothetical protein
VADALYSARQTSTPLQQPAGAMDMKDEDIFPESWETFESWIKAKVGGEIHWKIRPKDTMVNRQVVAESIIETMEKNDGTFPPSGNLFLELEED